MTLGGRRILPGTVRLVGRQWHEVTQELQEFLEVVQDSEDEGLSPGMDPSMAGTDITWMGWFETTDRLWMAFDEDVWWAEMASFPTSIGAWTKLDFDAITTYTSFGPGRTNFKYDATSDTIIFPWLVAGHVLFVQTAFSVGEVFNFL